MNKITYIENLKQYNGQNIHKVGEHISNGSVYCRNFYKLPNGIVVLVIYDEFYGNGEVKVIYCNEEINVGYVDIDGNLEITEKEYY